MLSSPLFLVLFSPWHYKISLLAVFTGMFVTQGNTVQYIEIIESTYLSKQSILFNAT